MISHIVVTKNLDLSQELHPNTVPKQCYFSCLHILKRVKRVNLDKAVYVEGLAIRWFGFEHGWLEMDGEIIDPTLPDAEMVYFPVLCKPRAEMLLLKNKDLPLFYGLGWGGGEQYGDAWKLVNREMDRMYGAGKAAVR